MRARVVPHDKVVPVVVALLVSRDGARQGEDAPVVEGADHAALAEDTGTGCRDDSVSPGGGDA